MSQIQKLHRKAMDLAEAAEVAKVRGNQGQVTLLLEQAFQHEKKAAELAGTDLQREPTRSVLHRSAASLALECGHLRDAEQLIARALAGNPPDEIADELRDLLEQVYFERHLSLRGLFLSKEEMQLSLSGSAVGFGVIESEEFIGRVQAIERLVFRTAERKAGLDYREQGSPDKKLKENLEVFLAVPRAASYSVTLKVGRPDRQPSFPGWEDVQVDEVIDDMLTNLERLNSGDTAAIKRAIRNKPYRNNFIALAKKIAPDGESIRQVGLTVMRRGIKRDLALKKRASEISPALASKTGDQPKRKPETVEGTFRYADGRSSRSGQIKIIDREGAEHRIIVPPGMMNDIVRPLWNDYVVVTGRRDAHGRIVMEDIRKGSQPT